MLSEVVTSDIFRYISYLLICRRVEMTRNGKKIDSRGSAIVLRETYNFVKFNNKLIQWVLGHILIKKTHLSAGKR